MAQLSDHDVEVRFTDILNNLTLLTGDGKIGVPPPTSGIAGEYWWILCTHSLEEMRLRHGEYPNGFRNGFIKKASLVNPTFPAPPRGKQSIDPFVNGRTDYLYKFGKAIHLENALYRGVLRIAPASIYNDPSLNSAIRDDELSLSITMREGTIRIRRSEKPPIAPYGNVLINFAAKTNYYVSCFASKYTHREFDDFGADCCLVITDPRTLLRKMMKAVRAHDPELQGFSSPVNYVDPLNAVPLGIDVTTCKHFRYAYQNEYRAVWVPKQPVKKLEPFEIEIGEMSGYAKLIRLEEPSFSP